MTSRLARLAVAGRTGSRQAVELCRSGYTRPPYDSDTYGRSFDAALAGSIKFWTKWQEEADVIRGALFPDATTPATIRPSISGPEVSREDEPAAATAVTLDAAPPTPASNYDALAAADSSVETDVLQEVKRRIVRQEADRRLQERDGTQVELPGGWRLDEFLDQPDNEPEWRVEGLLPTGGNVLLAAQYKTGKSTCVLNLIRSFADGDPFLGEYRTQPCHVAVVDDEMDARQWRRRLREQGIANPTSVTVYPIRGQVATFNVLDPVIRARWADLLRGNHVLIFDCLRPALDALGLSEDKEAGRFLVNLDALKREAGVSELVAVHHAGHDGQRARGDSRLLDWPDANWKIMRQRDNADDQAATDPSAPREFEAYGREVSIPPRVIVHDEATQRWTLGAGRAPVAGAAVITQTILDVIKTNPGITQNNLVAEVMTHGLPKHPIRGELRKLEAAGRIYTRRGAGGSYEYHLLGWTG